jgi:hypothetical protein
MHVAQSIGSALPRIDDDDDPTGERADENEASVREKDDNIVAEEFQ